MSGVSASRLWPRAPSWGSLPALVIVVAGIVLVCVVLAPASAQPRPKPDKVAPGAPDTKAVDAKAGGDGKDKTKQKPAGGPKTFDFTALDLDGRMRSPQLLYFLERANEELERASLEKRSFIPHLVRSLEEEAL